MGLEDIGDLAGALANPYGLPARDKWNLQEATFTPSDGLIPGVPISFFVADTKKEPKTSRTAMETATDSGGRRLAIYEFPYKDGQIAEDLGRKGERWVFNIVFFGKNYQTKLKQFENSIIKKKALGTLSHPVRGNMQARFSDYEMIHSYDKFSSVTLRTTWVEDNSAVLLKDLETHVSVDSALLQALQFLNDAQGFIGAGIFSVGALLLLPNAIKNSMLARLNSITGSLTGLLGQISATFSPTGSTTEQAAQGTLTSGSSGTTSSGQVVPPVFQVGLTEGEASLVAKNQSDFINANTVTPAQLAYQMNQVRAQIGAAIAEIETNMGSSGAEMVLSYRRMAVQFQATAEAAIANSQISVKLYTVEFGMSMRMAAFRNNLGPDRQNDIVALNPSVASVNYVPRGTLLVVPAR